MCKGLNDEDLPDQITTDPIYVPDDSDGGDGENGGNGDGGGDSDGDDGDDDGVPLTSLFFQLIVHYTIERTDREFLGEILQEYAYGMDRWFEFVYMERGDDDIQLPPLLEILGPEQYAMLATDPELIQAFENAHLNEGFSVHVGTKIWYQFCVPIEWEYTRW